MKIWNEEILPTEWMEGIICPIFKKGDRTIRSNYRQITPLNAAYKILTILINNRVSSIVESKLEDCQMGFRPNRSTIDNIFIVQQIIGKVMDLIQEDLSESKERFAIQRYLLIIGKKQNMQVLSYTFTYFST